MSDILFVNACLRPDSRTLRLAEALLRKMQGNADRLDLYSLGLSPLDLESMKKRDKASATRDYSDEIFKLAKQFAEAKEIVIAAPYWDLMFPAVLKLYLETVTVSGVTFRYSSEGFPIGLCSAQKLYYVTTAGGFIRDNDFGFKYVKTLAQNFYGIRDVKCISAEGLDISPDKADALVKTAEDSIEL